MHNIYIYVCVCVCVCVRIRAAQVQFWKKRQAEYEPYVLQHSPIPIQQGDLSNAIYFDFISYAQFLTVNTAIEKSSKLFEELDGAEGLAKTVQRSELLESKRARAEGVAQVAGAKIFQGLSEGFQVNMTCYIYIC